MEHYTPLVYCIKLLSTLVPRNHLLTETEWRNLGVQQREDTQEKKTKKKRHGTTAIGF